MAIASAHRNISENARQQAEAAQQWNETKFRSLIEGSLDIISLIDKEGTILYKSPSITPVLGFAPDELIGRNAFEVVHPEDRERVMALFGKLLQEPQRPMTGEFRHLHKDGSYRWVEGLASNRLAEPGIGAIVLNYRDISQRKQIEALLQEKLKQLETIKQDLDEQNRALMVSRAELEFERRRYLELFDFAPDGYLVTDLDGFIQEANLAACRMLRQDRNFLRRLPLVQFFDWEDRQKVRELLSRFQGGPVEKSESMEARLQPLEGEPISCSLMINAVPGELGSVVGLRWLVRDITPLKQTEQSLREREGHLRVLTETMPAVPWSATPEGGLDYFSDKWITLTGLTREQALGEGFKRALFPEDVPRVEAVMAHSMQTGEPFDVEHRIRGPDGTTRWYRSRALPQRDASGRIVRWYGITDDIHELKTALDAVRHSEQQLRQSEQRLRLALSSAAMGFYERDARTNQAIYDAQCRSILGLPEGASDLEAFGALLHPEDRLRVLTAAQRALDPAVREVASEEFRIIQPDGKTGWVSASGRVLFDDSVRPPQPATLMGVVQDITQRKLAEEELKQTQKRLARSNEELEHTVAERTAKLREMIGELEHMSYSIVHDMRAPLRAMISFGEILRSESGQSLNDHGRELLQRIISSASRMDLLITDALNYSKAVRRDLPLSAVDPERLLQGMLKSYPQFHLSQAEIRLEGHFPSVLANEAGLVQCCSNLLNNAVKFVGPGKRPRVRIWAESRASRARLWFEDNGPGIPRESQRQLFGMFQRLHGGEYEGTGIGLALVRKIMDRMGGKVGVESEPGKGSRFWLELRRAELQSDGGKMKGAK
jgi:PAS domain S-box-containing protein